MFNDIQSLCRAAACLTHADGRTRYVFENGHGPTVTEVRPKSDHIEIWRSREAVCWLFGTKVRRLSAGVHPATASGFVYADADGRWSRDWYHEEYMVFDRDMATDELSSVSVPTQAFWSGGKVVELSAGFVVQPAGEFQIGADVFTLLEAADGEVFLVEGIVKLCSALPN